MLKKFCLEILKGTDCLEDLGINRKIILKWIQDLCGTGCGLVVACCEHGNKPLSSIKGREFS
jgi:hypothetical protein